jgi:hypothetical protein
MSTTLPARRAILVAALAFARLGPVAHELVMLHRWLDSWAGVGQVVAEMQRHGWDVQLTAYGDGSWRATFYVTGMAHSIVGGSAWAPTPWRAVQRAGWDALTRSSEGGGL